MPEALAQVDCAFVSELLLEVGLANKELLQGQDIVATRMFDGTNLTKSMSITLHGRIIDKERERETL